MKRSAVVGESKWVKGDKECTVHSFRGTENGNRDGLWKVTFTGWNPFPCYRMETTMGVLFNWLKENGWTRIPGGCIEYSQEEYSDHTLECVSEKHWQYKYIPAKKTQA